MVDEVITEPITPESIPPLIEPHENFSDVELTVNDDVSEVEAPPSPHDSGDVRPGVSLVTVLVRGGIVQHVLCEDMEPQPDVLIMDYDTDFCNEDSDIRKDRRGIEYIHRMSRAAD